MSSNENAKGAPAKPARAWETPELKDAGNVADVLQGGGGKLSYGAQDTGDPRKPTGSQ